MAAMQARTAVSLLLALTACTNAQRSTEERPSGAVRLVFKQQPLWGDPAPFQALIEQFERAHPGVDVVAEYLPNASDLAHQFYLTSLEGGARDFDVMVIDVVWAPEFARAGWAADLTKFFPPGELKQDFLPGPVEAVVVDGKTWAVPWYVDVGLLYYRTDLVPRAPRTYEELIAFAQEARKENPALAGYVWQGKQYEGLNCNVFEAIWGHGGEALRDGKLKLDTPEAREALAYLRRLLETGVSPGSVTSAAEEEARRVFGSGNAVFMRNWPYAWGESQKEDSPIRGKVGFSPLPTESGEPGAGTLGGWQLAVNAHIPEWKKEVAAQFVRHLTSPEANLLLATRYARNPTRRSVYESAALREQAPFIADLLPAVERAKPRPVSPWYMLITDTLQGEFSAAISGLRAPEAALSRAQKLSDHLSGGEE